MAHVRHLHTHKHTHTIAEIVNVWMRSYKCEYITFGERVSYTKMRSSRHANICGQMFAYLRTLKTAGSCVCRISLCVRLMYKVFFTVRAFVSLVHKRIIMMSTFSACRAVIMYARVECGQMDDG